MNVLEIGKGKLSYALAVIAIAGGIASLIGGFSDQETAIKIIWGGLALFGIRRAI